MSRALLRLKEKQQRYPTALNTPPKPQQPGKASAITSKLCATKQGPRVSPTSLSCVDTRLVEVGHLQLSQSCMLKHEIVTDRQHAAGRHTTHHIYINRTMEACTHPAMKRGFYLQTKQRHHYEDAFVLSDTNGLVQNVGYALSKCSYSCLHGLFPLLHTPSNQNLRQNNPTKTHAYYANRQNAP